mmetsp:Transcript_73884/g.205427  ORF Transcript_73884/g.205427 Transcript_73884/m.205427 type:complete len:84 (-) Transcript_73884:32-283(-)
MWYRRRVQRHHQRLQPQLQTKTRFEGYSTLATKPSLARSVGRICGEGWLSGERNVLPFIFPKMQISFFSLRFSALPVLVEIAY